MITRTENGTDTLCKFMRAVEALKSDPLFDDGDAAIVKNWLNGRTPASHIGRALRETAYPVSNTRVKEHRLGDCNCGMAG